MPAIISLFSSNTHCNCGRLEGSTIWGAMTWPASFGRMSRAMTAMNDYNYDEDDDVDDDDDHGNGNKHGNGVTMATVPIGKPEKDLLRERNIARHAEFAQKIYM